MLDIELIDIIANIDYTALFYQGSTIGLILGGSVSIFGYGIMYALKLFKII